MNRVLASVAAVALLATMAWAQTPGKTKVVLTELDCMGCAKKIATKLYKVEGVGEVRVDLESRSLFIAHKTGMTPSPKGMWEAIEQADHTPERMETPSGTLSSKPKS